MPKRPRPAHHRDPKTGQPCRAWRYSWRVTQAEFDWLKHRAKERSLSISRLCLLLALGHYRLPRHRLPIAAATEHRRKTVRFTINDCDWLGLVTRARTWQPHDPDPVLYALEVALRGEPAGNDSAPVLLETREELMLYEALAPFRLGRQCRPEPSVLSDLKRETENLRERFELFGAQPEDDARCGALLETLRQIKLELLLGADSGTTAKLWETVLDLLREMGRGPAAVSCL